MNPAQEYNFDGIVGPTYHFGGLAFGNVASMEHKGRVASPREAALEGLAKMYQLMELGLPQCVLPPQERPQLSILRNLGYEGSDGAILEMVHKTDPALLSAVSSASAMWTANAATVTPSADAQDGKVHVTPANLVSHLHRSVEAPQTTRILRAIFKDPARVVVHDPLPAATNMCDEGAANHLRLCAKHGGPGLEVFVYGREGTASPSQTDFSDMPVRFPARQTLLANRAIARRHRLMSERTLFLGQNPALIDLGVFHNDVIAVANERVLLSHDLAFKGGADDLEVLEDRFRRTCGQDLCLIRVTAEALPIEEAVATYLFNSQIVTLPKIGMALICPVECDQYPGTRSIITSILSDRFNPITAVHYVRVRQSMKNGGGPACLRLRVVLTEEEAATMNPSIVLTPGLYKTLISWVQRYYRPRLQIDDLADPKLLDEARTAIDELTTILNLGSIYDFQR